MSLSVLGLLLSSLSVAFLPPENRDIPPIAQDRYGSELWVSLASVKARIVDEEGAPIPDLKPENLRVRVNGRTAPVVAIDYYDEAVHPEALADEKVVNGVSFSAKSSPHQISGRGQMFVFFVDTELTDQSHLPETTEDLRRLVDSLEASVPAAVVSLDSRLKLQVDLTDDRDSLFQALVSARQGGAGITRPASAHKLSLWPGWDEAAASRAQETEEALAITAAALDPLPGEKVLIYLGEGPGNFTEQPVSGPSPEVLAVARAIREARATLFALVKMQTPDSYAGLKYLSASTGGSYLWPKRGTRSEAIDSLISQTRGYHVISFRLKLRPKELGSIPLTIKLVGREGKILAPFFEILRARR